MDSPAANGAFAKQINIKFPLLSDMNGKMLKTYGILKGYNVENPLHHPPQKHARKIARCSRRRWRTFRSASPRTPSTPSKSTPSIVAAAASKG
jgi:hypothetical protein